MQLRKSQSDERTVTDKKGQVRARLRPHLGGPLDCRRCLPASQSTRLPHLLAAPRGDRMHSPAICSCRCCSLRLTKISHPLSHPAGAHAGGEGAQGQEAAGRGARPPRPVARLARPAVTPHGWHSGASALLCNPLPLGAAAHTFALSQAVSTVEGKKTGKTKTGFWLAERQKVAEEKQSNGANKLRTGECSAGSRPGQPGWARQEEMHAFDVRIFMQVS